MVEVSCSHRAAEEPVRSERMDPSKVDPRERGADEQGGDGDSEGYGPDVDTDDKEIGLPKQLAEG